eukprot:5292966-Alexandrium_andersonii.AAC.1
MGPPKRWQAARCCESATGAPRKHGKCCGMSCVTWAPIVACKAMPSAALALCSWKVPSSTQPLSRRKRACSAR